MTEAIAAIAASYTAAWNSGSAEAVASHYAGTVGTSIDRGRTRERAGNGCRTRGRRLARAGRRRGLHPAGDLRRLRHRRCGEPGFRATRPSTPQ
ncbi:hypothetical protein DR046_19870 [Jannaschia formosa]|nr:hypothetical protein DR046_19870 [Jannaschia formosa]